MPRHVLGRLPRDPNAPIVDLTKHLKVNATALPASVDWYSKVTDWGMLLNDQLGDCTCAGDGHIAIQQSVYHGTPVTVTNDEVLQAYEVVGGYVPGDPSTDQGATVQAALAYLEKYGLAGFKIAAFGDVDVKDYASVKRAIWEFGAVSLGVNLPESAEEQFAEGEPWNVVNGSPIEGGHCIIAVGYDADYVYCVTWGAVVPVSWGWWAKYVEEAFAVISEDWVTVSGLSLDAFGAEFAVAFDVPNPFTKTGPPAPASAPESFWQRIWDFLKEVF